MFEKILVPLDGSELAEYLLPYVSQLARGLDVPLLLLYVIDPEEVEIPEELRGPGGDPLTEHIEILGMEIGSSDFAPAGFAAGGAQPPPGPVNERGWSHATQIYEEAALEIRRRLDKVAVQLEENGLKAKSAVSFGKAAEEIVRIAEREHCSLIAMSTHSRSALGRGVLGSVTDRVVHTSHIPTLVITPERAKVYWIGEAAIGGVIVPLDGSPLAEAALPYAETLAKKLSLEMVLVRVAKAGGAYPFVGTAGLEVAIEKEGVEYLEGVSERLRNKGLKVSYEFLRGSPAAAIVDFAQSAPQNIIVMTTHGRSGFRRMLIGSVTEALVRASGDPVLIIPPAEE